MQQLQRVTPVLRIFDLSKAKEFILIFSTSTEKTAWHTFELSIVDPFANRLTFWKDQYPQLVLLELLNKRTFSIFKSYISSVEKLI